MLKKILLALIFVITATSTIARAESDLKTVASKAYVDTKIETKQLKIPAANTPGVGAGETVMTYTATGNGQIGERGLYSDISSYNATTDGDKLITASALNATFTNLPTTGTTKLECANESDGCTLWTIVDQTAYGDMLPTGYTRLEYIESTGTQYINTGIKDTSKVEMDINITAITNDYTLLYGSQKTGTIVRRVASLTSDSRVFGVNVGSNSSASRANTGRAITLNTFHNVTFIFGTTAQIIEDGVTYTARNSGDNASTGLNDYLFCYNYAGSPNYKVKAKISYAKIWGANGTLVRDFVPAKNASNVVGMYDTVSGRFFTNAATSGPDFRPGPESSAQNVYIPQNQI